MKTGKRYEKFSVACLAGCAAVFLCVCLFAVAGGATQTYASELKLANAPTVVLDVTDKAALDGIASKQRKPSNAILRFDKDCNVAGANGEILGDFASIYQSVLVANGVLPVLRIADEAEANAAIKYLGENPELTDIAVTSQNADLVKKVRVACQKIRGIVEYAPDTKLHDLVSVTNSSYANVAVVPQSMATVQNVRYVHARFKTVWVIPESNDKFDLYDCAGSGAYGIVSPDTDSVYDALGEYEAEGGLVRTPFNVGHRGAPRLCNENSVSGTRMAAEIGATHVELDAYMTADNQIVMSHDRDIARTTNGKGDIEAFAFAELRGFELDLFEREPIPSFEDIANALKGTDLVLVLEIKSAKRNFAQVLREKLEETDMRERTVVISFNRDILEDMKNTIPQIPTANLNAVFTDNFEEMLGEYCVLNTGVDAPYVAGATEFNEKYLRDRGFVGWYWTFDNLASMMTADKAGFVGLTNNCPEEFAFYPQTVEGIETYGVKNLAAGDEITVTVTDYCGEKREEQAKVFRCEDRGDCFYAVAVYGRYYTQGFYVYKNEPLHGSGCSGAAGFGSAAIASAVLLVSAALCFAHIKVKQSKNIA